MYKVADLTREQILAMPAGREMDALVAERVFGWHRLGKAMRPPQSLLSVHTSYSTNIAAAWEVVEQMNMTWFQIRIARESGPEDAFYECFCYRSLECRPSWQGYGNTAPHAICRAALLATLESG